MYVTTHMSTGVLLKLQTGGISRTWGEGVVDDQADFRLDTTASHKQHATL